MAIAATCEKACLHVCPPSLWPLIPDKTRAGPAQQNKARVKGKHAVHSGRRCCLFGWALLAQARDLKILTGAGMSMPVRALAADYRQPHRHPRHGGQRHRRRGAKAHGRRRGIRPGDRHPGGAGHPDQGRQSRRRNMTELAQMVAGIGAQAGTPKPAIATATRSRPPCWRPETSPMSIRPRAASPACSSSARPTSWASASKCAPRPCCKPNGTGVAAAVACGEAQYGVTLVSEMLPNKGVTVWPLPDDAADDHHLCRRSFQRCRKRNGRQEPAG